jgi:hypothetical protein
MDATVVTDAGAAYLDRIAEDCARLLGPEIELDGLERGEDAEVVLTLRYRLGAVKRMSEGRGDTVVAAHADLRQRLVLDRIRIGTSAMYRQRR